VIFLVQPGVAAHAEADQGRRNRLLAVDPDHERLRPCQDADHGATGSGLAFARIRLLKGVDKWSGLPGWLVQPSVHRVRSIKRGCRDRGNGRRLSMRRRARAQ
jgi:hypothetical protein